MRTLTEWQIIRDSKKLEAIQSILADGFLIQSFAQTGRPVRLKISIEIDPEDESFQGNQMVQDLKRCVETGKDPRATSLGHLGRNLENAPHTYSELAQYVHDRRLLKYNEWPLEIAVREGYMQVVQFLVENGAGPNENKTEEVKQVFATCRNVFLFQYLLERGYPFHKDSLGLLRYALDIISFKEILWPVILEKGDFPPLFPPSSEMVFNTGRLEIIKYYVQQGLDLRKFWNKFITNIQLARPMEDLSIDYPLLLMMKDNYLDIFKFIVENINVSTYQLGLLSSRYSELCKKRYEESKETPAINETEYYISMSAVYFGSNLDTPVKQAHLWKQIESDSVLEETKKWLQTSSFVTHQRIPSKLLIQINQVMHLALIPHDPDSTPDFKLKKICKLPPLNPFATEYAWWKNYKINPLSYDDLRKAYEHYETCTRHITEIHEHDNYKSLNLQALMDVSPGRDIFSAIKVLFDMIPPWDFMILKGDKISSPNFIILKVIMEYATVHFMTPGLLHIGVALRSKDKCLACMEEFKQVSFFPGAPKETPGIMASLSSWIEGSFGF